MSPEELEELQYHIAWALKHAQRAVEAAKKADEFLDKLATQRSPTLRTPVHEREWVCLKCTTTNMLDVPICQACGASRSGG